MMYVMQILGNRPIWAGIYAWFIAQAIKVVLTFISEKRFAIDRMWGSGGMPSSHSALVCALTVCIGKHFGFDAPIFAVSVVMSFVVMYDACGVRRAAGKQAELLNKIIETPGLTGVQVRERLVEALGHTPVQVFVGALIGIVVGLIA